MMKKCTFVCGTQAICVGKAYNALICDYLSLESKKMRNPWFYCATRPQTSPTARISSQTLIDALLCSSRISA